MSRSGSVEPDPGSSATLPVIWHAVQRRVAAKRPVPRGLLLRVIGSPALLRQLIAAAREGASGPDLTGPLGLGPEHGELVRQALLPARSLSNPVPAPAATDGTDRSLADQLRHEVEAGMPLEQVIASHQLSQTQRLQYLTRSGLARLAQQRRQQARQEVQMLIGSNADAPVALLATATGLSSARVTGLLEALRAGEGLMQAISEQRVPWSDGRLIARAIRWRPSWRRRERRVGRLTFSEVVTRAASNQDPVWIAEAAGVRAQWIRQLLRRYRAGEAGSTLAG